MKRLFLALFILLFPSIPSSAKEKDVSFLRQGHIVKSVPLSQLKKTFKSSEVLIWEPHEKRNLTLQVFSTQEVLDKVYGKKWRQFEEILFVASDGYKAAVKTSLFGKRPSYLAFKIKGRNTFSVKNELQHGRETLLGPIYLIWQSSAADAKKKSFFKEFKWPYQVVSINLTDGKTRYVEMKPPAGSSAEIWNGFKYFKTYCTTCHKINGEGGDLSYELNTPVSVTEYFKKTWLKKWIINPRAIRPKSQMPPVLRDTPNAEKIADDLVKYLEAMATKKKKS